MNNEDLSPWKKAQHTAKWARTMTKWLVTYSRRQRALWTIVDFGGVTGSESRGIVDLMAVRKDHRSDSAKLRRGDLLEIVLIQTKGGSAPLPTTEDRPRLARVARHHRASMVVLATWRRGEKLNLFELKRSRWKAVSPSEVFS